MKSNLAASSFHATRKALQEPIGYFAGTNLYEFVRGNPIHFTDPRGLDATYSGDEVPAAGGTIKLPGGGIGTVKVYQDVTRHIEGKEDEEGWVLFSYATQNAPCNCHWVQFYRFEYTRDGTALDHVFYGGGTYHKAGETYLDTIKGRDNPWIDAGASENFVFSTDRPGDDNIDQQVVVREYFDTYLMCEGNVKWHVHWERVDKYDEGQEWQYYENITGEPANGLPPELAGKQWLEGYEEKDLKKPLYRDSQLKP